VYSFTTLNLPSTASIVITIPGQPFIPATPGDPNRGILPQPGQPFIPPQQRIIDIPTTVQTQVRVPILVRGGYKIAENASPAPLDRVFFTYNYYNNVHGPGGAAPSSVNQTFLVNGALFTAAVPVPGVPGPRGDLHRETFGFEKTFFDGNTSLGVAVPFFQGIGDNLFDASAFGDVTLYFKYAPFFDRERGNVFSLGMAVTLPTGPNIPLQNGDFHPTILQPYFGYMFTADRLFLH